MRPRNWLLFVVVVLLWGLSWWVMKVALSFVSPIALILHQFIVSIAALAPVFFILRKKTAWNSNTLGRLLLSSLIFDLQIILQRAGLVGENSGIGAVFTYTYPIFVCCFAILLLREKVTVVNFFGIIFGLLGVFILVGSRANFSIGSSSLVLLFGAFIWAVSVLYYKKFLNHLDPFLVTFSQLSIGIIPIAILSFITNSFVLPGETAYLSTLFYSSIGSLAIGTVIWLYLLQEEKATVLSGSTLIVPVIALIFGWLLLGETIGFEAIFGSALVLGGLCLVNLPATNRISTLRRRLAELVLRR